MGGGGGGGDVGCIEVGESDMRTVNYVCILHICKPYKDPHVHNIIL